MSQELEQTFESFIRTQAANAGIYLKELDEGEGGGGVTSDFTLNGAIPPEVNLALHEAVKNYILAGITVDDSVVEQFLENAKWAADTLDTTPELLKASAKVDAIFTTVVHRVASTLLAIDKSWTMTSVLEHLGSTVQNLHTFTRVAELAGEVTLENVDTNTEEERDTEN